MVNGMKVLIENCKFGNIIWMAKMNKIKKTMTTFEFIGQFFFQNDIFKLQEIFSELRIRVFLENGLGSFHTVKNKDIEYCFPNNIEIFL
jgi:hypothetical protein